MTYELAIIGGGPGGYTAAEHAAMHGISTILFEKSAVGGVCLNEGCIPTKTLLYAAKILNKAENSRKYAVNIPTAEIDLPKLIGRKNKIIKKLTAGIRMGLEKQGVTFINEKAEIKRDKSNDGLFIIQAGENNYNAKKILIATGSETIIPPIRGIKEAEIWTSREALMNKEIPSSLTVIGGGVIGMEFVSFFANIGTKVTVVEMMPKILGETDEEISNLLLEEYKKKGVTFHLSSRVTEIRDNTVIVESPEGEIEIESEKIMLSVGRKPTLTGFGLEDLDLEKYGNGLKVNDKMQTSNPDIYACGDVTGFSLLAHTASREGQVAVNHILGKEDSMSYKAIPGIVYTDPEVSSIGNTEKMLTEKGIPYKVKKLPMTFSGRFVIENEMGNGLCKLLVSEDNQILGGHMIGNPSSEIITTIGVAIEQNMTLEQLSRIVFPHPTVTEIIHQTIFAEEE